MPDENGVPTPPLEYKGEPVTGENRDLEVPTATPGETPVKGFLPITSPASAENAPNPEQAYQLMVDKVTKTAERITRQPMLGKEHVAWTQSVLQSALALMELSQKPEIQQNIGNLMGTFEKNKPPEA